MLIIWRGKGFLVAAILLGALILTQLTVDGMNGDGTYQQNPSLWGGIALLGAGALLSWWGAGLNRPLVDPATGREFVRRRVHTLFFLPVDIWGAVSLAGGAVAILASLLG